MRNYHKKTPALGFRNSHTIWLALLLPILIVLQSCSNDSPRKSKRTVQPRTVVNPKVVDDPADDPSTPPKTSVQLPTVRTPPKQTFHSERLNTLRNQVAREACIAAGTTEASNIDSSLAELKCRLDEQESWLNDTLLYSPSSNTACRNQTSELKRTIFTHSGSADASGTQWKILQCQKATDQALKNLNANTRESTNNKVQKNELKAKLRTLLNQSVAYSSNAASHNIATVVKHSLYKLNHNCASSILTSNFPSTTVRATANTNNSRVKISYHFREYFPSTDSPNHMDPLIRVSWDDIQTNIKAYKDFKGPLAGSTTADSSLSSINAYLGYRSITKPKPDDFAIRELKRSCTAHNQAYKTIRGSSTLISFFDYSRFQVALDSSKVTCTQNSENIIKIVRPHNPSTTTTTTDNNQTGTSKNPKKIFDSNTKCKIFKGKDYPLHLTTNILITSNTRKTFFDAIACSKTLPADSTNCPANQRFTRPSRSKNQSPSIPKNYFFYKPSSKDAPTRNDFAKDFTDLEAIVKKAQYYRNTFTANPMTAYFANSEGRFSSGGNYLFQLDERPGNSPSTQVINECTGTGNSRSCSFGFDVPDSLRVSRPLCLYTIYMNVDGFTYKGNDNENIGISSADLEKSKLDNRRSLEKMFGLNKITPSQTCSAKFDFTERTNVCKSFRSLEKGHWSNEQRQRLRKFCSNP